jgi:hypothetical protein
MSGKETMSKEELETLKKQWLEEMKANMKVYELMGQCHETTVTG